MLGQQNSTAMGDTVTVTINNVSAGQVYDIRCRGTTTGDSGFGAYGLQVNFGSLTQPPVTAPNTVMAEAADQGGGTMSESTSIGDANRLEHLPQDGSVIPGVPTFWVYDDNGSTVSEDNGDRSIALADNGDPLADPSNADLLTTDVVPSPDDTTPTDGSGHHRGRGHGCRRRHDDQRRGRQATGPWTAGNPDALGPAVAAATPHHHLPARVRHGPGQTRTY